MKFEKELVATIVDPGFRHVKYRKITIFNSESIGIQVFVSVA